MHQSPASTLRMSWMQCRGSGGQNTFGDGSTSGTRKAPLTITDPDWASVSMNSNNACGIYAPTSALRCW